MLLFLIFVSIFAFSIVAPLMALKRYYRPSNYSILANIGWIALGILSWPLVPIILAAKHHDKLILSIVWVSFLIFGVATAYWVATNAETILEFQHTYLAGIN